jgi:3-oxoacyl-[acyl-carrier protein] reductase/(S)-1-phenylethanol dehydrogenase
MDFDGKVAIVTGASSGIGRAYALALAGAGATVVAAARRLGGPEGEADTLAEVVAASRPLRGQVYAQVCDVTVEADIQRMIDQAAANFGGVDVLVNNAGIFPRQPTFEITREQWDASMDLNLRAPYLTIRYAAPHMIRRGGGGIVNITAGAAGFFPKGSLAHDDLLTYALSKSALNRLTTFMSEELKEHGIAVNALSPGVVRTRAFKAQPKLPAGVAPAAKVVVKEPTPEALGPALLHLAAQTARTLTGQILHTDEFGKSWP